MNIVILGCGRVGSTLASTMSRNGHNVTIIDKSGSAFYRLSPDFKGGRIVGNGTDDEVLKKAGIEKADAFVALTQGDNTNIMSVQIAKTKFKVKKTVARMYDPIRSCAYHDLGVDTICTTVVGARLFRDFLQGDDMSGLADYCSLSEEEPII
jgi:trk system potassium uptake protein